MKAGRRGLKALAELVKSEAARPLLILRPAAEKCEGALVARVVNHSFGFMETSFTRHGERSPPDIVSHHRLER